MQAEIDREVDGQGHGTGYVGPRIRRTQRVRGVCRIPHRACSQIVLACWPRCRKCWHPFIKGVPHPHSHPGRAGTAQLRPMPRSPRSPIPSPLPSRRQARLSPSPSHRGVDPDRPVRCRQGAGAVRRVSPRSSKGLRTDGGRPYHQASLYLGDPTAWAGNPTMPRPRRQMVTHPRTWTTSRAPPLGGPGAS